MIGIIGEIGKVLIVLQDEGRAVIKGTDEFFPEEILFYVEQTLNGLKVAYKTEVDDDLKIKIFLQ